MKHPRTLAGCADAFDEHLALVRIADEECFDIVKLQAGLSRFLDEIGMAIQKIEGVNEQLGGDRFKWTSM